MALPSADQRRGDGRLRWSVSRFRLGKRYISTGRPLTESRLSAGDRGWQRYCTTPRHRERSARLTARLRLLRGADQLFRQRTHTNFSRVGAPSLHVSTLRASLGAGAQWAPGSRANSGTRRRSRPGAGSPVSNYVRLGPSRQIHSIHLSLARRATFLSSRHANPYFSCVTVNVRPPIVIVPLR